MLGLMQLILNGFVVISLWVPGFTPVNAARTSQALTQAQMQQQQPQLSSLREQAGGQSNLQQAKRGGQGNLVNGNNQDEGGADALPVENPALSNMSSEAGEKPQYKICPITEYYCKPNTDDIVAMVDATNVDDCNKECNKNEKCKIFTFLRLRGKGQCFLLKDCSEKKQTCADRSKCQSGWINCADRPFCPKLDVPAQGSEVAIWQCGGGINPYKEEIPDGVLCHTMCQAWTTKEGKEIVVMSACDNNVWTEVESYPVGEYNEAVPLTLSKPTTPMQCPEPAECPALKLSYDPNKEVGTDFYCSPGLNLTSASPTSPVRIEDKTKCVLLCDKWPAAHLQCIENKWVGKPELGFWCNEQQDPVKIWTD